MNTTWQQFLAEIHYPDENKNQASNNGLAVSGNIICNLSQYALIVVAGPDASSFLQGQLTNDVNLVNDKTSQLTALCNNKGRMISNLTLFQYQGNFFIKLHRDLINTVIEQLQKYIVSAQVAVQDVTDQLVQTGISGKAAITKLAEHLQLSSNTVLQQAKNSLSANDDYIVIKTADTQPRYEIFSPPAKARDLWLSITEIATPVTGNTWEYLNILVGLPVIKPATSAEFVPQMVNLDILDGISFKKGCYTGQEIVARMHYLGKLKKRMVKVHIKTEENKPPQSGDKVFAENAKAGQNTGILIDAQPNPDNGYDALAVIQLADIDSTLKLYNTDGPELCVETLPYSISSPAE